MVPQSATRVEIRLMSESPAASFAAGTTDGTRLAASSVGLMAAAGALAWVGIVTLGRSGGVADGLAAGRAVLLAPSVLAVVGVVLVLERCWPAEPRRFAARGHLQDGAFFLLHVLAIVPFMTLLSVAFAHLLEVGLPWMALAWTRGAPIWVLAPVTFVMMDAGNWLAHWADHRFTSLWRVHALHHSQEEVSVLTSFRAHPLSHLPGFMLAAVPPFLLLSGRGAAPAMISVYVCLGTVPHANLDWSFGPFGRILVSPAYHRLHHALDGETGRNLGVVLTVWDVLSKRSDFPARDRRPRRTGLPGRPVPVEQADVRWHPEILLRQLGEPFLARPG
jgi:sterol desaturase/sphingolipid hydroxylase (fatty acid hydroxylase superfamily)